MRTTGATPTRSTPFDGHRENFTKCILDVLWHCSPFLQTAVRGTRTRGSGNCSAVLPADCGNRRRSAQSARVNSSTDRGPLNAPARAGSVHIHVMVALRDRRALCRFWYFRHRRKLRRGGPPGRPLASDGHFESGRSARSSSPVCLLRRARCHTYFSRAQRRRNARGVSNARMVLVARTAGLAFGPVQFDSRRSIVTGRSRPSRS